MLSSQLPLNEQPQPPPTDNTLNVTNVINQAQPTLIQEVYTSICFGRPFDFDHFVENIKQKNIIFDSGMYEGNSRNYSQFRSHSAYFWNQLITEEYS